VAAVQDSAECGGDGKQSPRPACRSGRSRATDRRQKAVGVVGLAQSAGELVQPDRGVCNIESVDTDLMRAAQDFLTR